MTTTQTSSMQTPAGASKTAGRSLGRSITKVAVIVIALFALLSPAWVLLHGMGYLNQAPPPYWLMNAGVGGASHASGPASLGGC